MSSGLGAVGSLEELVQDAVDWASTHGLVVGLGGVAPAAALVHAPLSVLPVAFPRRRFEQAKAAMTAFNELVDAVASDEEYLQSTLAAAAQHDDFTARLLVLLEDSRTARQLWAEAGRQVTLGVHRSDYMLDEPSGGFLQVELNTIASSFGCLSTQTSRLHRHLLGRLGADSNPDSSGAAALALAALPENDATAAIADGMAAAAQAADAGPGAVVVMVVQPGERNAYDQQWLVAALWERHQLSTLRLTLQQIAQRCSVDETGVLWVSVHSGAGATMAKAAVALVYFRAGYTPDDYPGEDEWRARLVVESSRAARCPTVAYQLAGAKKVQQDLARPGVVERFVGQVKGEQLRGLFAGLWSLDDPSEPATAAIIAAAIADPGGYVLKPQREGGGNNMYGAELAARLQEGGPGLSAYILMQRIRPPPQRSLMVRVGTWAEDETLSELGVYGVYVKHNNTVLVNTEAGHLVRTKTSTSNEGGVAAGFAVLDSPYLVEGSIDHPQVLDVLAAASTPLA